MINPPQRNASEYTIRSSECRICFEADRAKDSLPVSLKQPGLILGVGRPRSQFANAVRNFANLAGAVFLYRWDTF